MGLFTQCIASFVVAGLSCVQASPAPVAEPVITPAAILPRVALSTLGWYTTTSGGLYVPWIFDADTSTYTSSGSFFRRCPLSSTCPLYTSCSAGYMVAASTSSFCGSSGLPGSSSLSYCSHHSLLPSLSAGSGGQSWLWCDTAPLTGNTIYIRQPAQPTATPVSNTARTTAASDTTGSLQRFTSPTRATSSGPTSSSTSTTTTTSHRGSIAAIAGGVVGGVALLGALAFAIILLMRRSRKKKNIAASAYQAAPLIGGGGPMAQHQYPYQPGGAPGYESQRHSSYYGDTAYQGAGGSESKPQIGGYGMAQQQQGMPGQQYPAGLYDPHRSLGYPPPGGLAGGVPQELENTVVYPPQELPASRK